MAKTLRKYGAKYNTTYCEFCGLSTDVKPVTSFGGINIANGSKFVEMNTNKEFRYDADAKVWHEVSEGGGSGGGGSATLIEREITENGTYNATDDDADGYSQVVVDVTPPSNEFYPSVKTQSLMVQNDMGNTWTTKTWNGLTSFEGRCVWTDGDNIYYNSQSNRYVLDKATSTWTTKTWNGLTSIRGANIWTDGDNIYYNYYDAHYYLPITKKPFPIPTIKR
jgi:signal peptidase I